MRRAGFATARFPVDAPARRAAKKNGTPALTGIFHASAILWIIATVNARRRASTSEAREREPRSSASSACVCPSSSMA